MKIYEVHFCLKGRDELMLSEATRYGTYKTLARAEEIAKNAYTGGTPLVVVEVTRKIITK
jgi:hypothetical protein